jgi:hypothetical protein
MFGVVITRGATFLLLPPDNIPRTSLPKPKLSLPLSIGDQKTSDISFDYKVKQR